VDAFAVRYTRLQDALGEKLLPTYFRLALEPVRPVRDMIDRAEQLGLIENAEAWIAAIPLLSTTLAALKAAIEPPCPSPT
jgi:hypothetical protein